MKYCFAPLLALFLCCVQKPPTVVVQRVEVPVPIPCPEPVKPLRPLLPLGDLLPSSTKDEINAAYRASIVLLQAYAEQLEIILNSYRRK
jgi:hypothetical protein